MGSEAVNQLPEGFRLSQRAKEHIAKLVTHWEQTEKEVIPVLLWFDVQPGINTPKPGIGASRKSEVAPEMIATVSGFPIVFGVAQPYRHFFRRKTLDFRNGDFVLVDET